MTQQGSLPIVQAFDANGNPTLQYAGTLPQGGGSIAITAAQFASPPAWLLSFLATGGMALFNGQRYVVNPAGTGLVSLIVASTNAAGNVTGYIDPVSGQSVLFSTLLSSSGIPFGVPSSGSIGNNGALTGLTAFPVTYPDMFLYFPAGAIAASGPGSAAGMYYVQMSSATAGTIFNNQPVAGAPAIPASPTPFVTTGPGAYTQTTGSQLTVLSSTIAAAALGANGELRTLISTSTAATAGAKNAFAALGGVSVWQYTIGGASSAACEAGFHMQNCGKFNRQFSTPATVNFTQGAVGVNGTRSTVDTSVAQPFALTIQLATATDYAVIERHCIELLPHA